MNIDDDLHALSGQETTLTFSHFDHNTAWELGSALKSAAEQRRLSIAIEIQLAGQTLFYYAMPGTTPRYRRLGTAQTQCGEALPQELLRDWPAPAATTIDSGRTLWPERQRLLSTRWRLPDQSWWRGLHWHHQHFWLTPVGRSQSVGRHPGAFSRIIPTGGPLSGITWPILSAQAA